MTDRVEAPTRIEVQACRDCGAPVFWWPWPKTGKRHIFDVRKLAFEDGRLTMQSHTITCAKGRRQTPRKMP